jgi:uncharacterized membrane protein
MARRKRRTVATRQATPAVPVLPVGGKERVAPVDALRGIAILAMVAYHFAFDLRFFDIIRADFENDRFWLTARGSIVTSFLLLAGVSLVLADRAGVQWTRFVRRIALIALCALAASIASYFVYPRTYIYFGILHCIALSLLVARPLADKPNVAVALGVVVVLAGLFIAHPAFDHRWTSWIGFTTHKPATQDFVPVFPWLGVVLLGIGVGHALLRARFRPIAGLGRAPRPLLWTGQHSLAIYMVHQPILMGALWLALRIRA